MKEAEFPTLGTLDSTLPSPGDPTYQQELLAYTLLQIIKNLGTEGFTFTKPDASDFTSYSNDVKTYIEAMNTREDEILASGFSSVVANLPDVLSIMGAISSGGLSEVPSILLNAMISQLFNSRDSAIEAKEGEILPADVDLSAVVARLEDIETAIQTILTEFSINLFQDDAESSWTVEPPVVG